MKGYVTLSAQEIVSACCDYARLNGHLVKKGGTPLASGRINDGRLMKGSLEISLELEDKNVNAK